MSKQTEQVNFFKDGITRVLFRAIDPNSGAEYGPYFEPGDAAGLSATRNVETRDVKAKNRTVKSSSAFQDYELSLGLVSQKPQYWNHFWPGDFVVSGDRITFIEDTSKQPQKFAMYAFGKVSGEDGEGDTTGGEYYRKFLDCQVTNIQDDQTTGEFTEFDVTIKGLADANDKAMHRVVDPTGFGTEFDPETTAPTTPTFSPLDSATDVAVDVAVTITFAERMDEVSLQRITLSKNSDSSEISCTRSYNTTTNVYTMTPDSDLENSTQYDITVPTSVRDLAQNNLASEASASFTTIA